LDEASAVDDVPVTRRVGHARAAASMSAERHPRLNARMKTMGALRDLRELNRQRVIDALRRVGTASRSELARATGLSRTTVSTVVSDLQERGLVVEQAAEDAPVQAGRGRPPVLVRLDVAAGAALGVAFSHADVRVAVADLSSSVLAEQQRECDVANRPAEAAFAVASELVDAAIAEAGVERWRLVGCTVGVPAPLDRASGVVAAPVILPGWADVPVAGLLSEQLDLAVHVDNDANLGAVGEQFFGAARGMDDFVYVKLSTGVGSALVLDRRVYRGATGVAGELGHVQVQDDGEVCRCGQRGCVGPFASTDGLLRLLAATHGPELTIEDVLELLASGDLGTRRVVNDAGRSLGRVLADLCNHLNPAGIVLGGELSAAGEPLLAGIRESVDRYALPAAADAVRIAAGELGPRAEVLGAVADVVRDTQRVRSAGLAAIGVA
jgi:predicted NBD/HSP70 family sugar kinase